MSALTRRFHLPSALRPSPFRIGVAEVRDLVAHSALLVDVRRQGDLSAPLEGAIRIAPDEVPGRVVEFRRDVAIVLACT